MRLEKNRQTTRNNAARKSLPLMLSLLLLIPSISMPALAKEQQLGMDLAEAKQLLEEFSKNGNQVTQYVNEEDQKVKTVIWAAGVTPPEMTDFIKEKFPAVGTPDYVTYKAPFQPGKGWYDVNKSTV